jgi:hypothetical protein
MQSQLDVLIAPKENSKNHLHYTQIRKQAQAAECLPSKYEALSSNSSTDNK